MVKLVSHVTQTNVNKLEREVLVRFANEKSQRNIVLLDRILWGVCWITQNETILSIINQLQGFYCYYSTSLVIFHILLTEGPSAILNNRDTKMVSGGLITTENFNCLTRLGRGLDYNMLNK